MKKLSLLLLVLFFTSVCAFVGENTKTPPSFAPTLTSAAQTETPPMVVMLPSSPTSSNQEEYGQVNLFCETYIETTWGSGPGQWGWLDSLEYYYKPSTLLPVKFDDAGRLYFADYVNLRLLRYDETNFSPMEISLTQFKSEVPWLFPFIFSIAIYQGEVLVPYGVQSIGILSTDTGNLMDHLQLPVHHYDPNYPTSTVT